MGYKREQAASDGPTSGNTKATCVKRTGGFFPVAKRTETCYTTLVQEEVGQSNAAREGG